MMQILVIVNVISFVLFIYGIYTQFVQLESNSCQMTYMFEEPRFLKIFVTRKKLFSNYGLYYYTEGYSNVDLQNLSGAPVVFVPGNAGSYKQARSFASVALRMSKDRESNKKLDYFTISYDEELSALFGGYLKKQRQFLETSIRAIERLYASKKNLNEPLKIVIIAHSMGGIVAQSILSNEKLATLIESIIFLATPLERPVVNTDIMMNQFYENNLNKTQNRETLLISIGGGVRDVHVPEWLTTSPHTHIHAITSAIPKVWVSCDHLSIVWCLQLTKLVNKFLFSIAKRRQSNNSVMFNGNFEFNYASAYKHFVDGTDDNSMQNSEINFNDNENNEFFQFEGTQQMKIFKNGIAKRYNQLVPVHPNFNGKKMYFEISESKIDNWLYGCVAKTNQSSPLTCSKITSMAREVSSKPNKKNVVSSYALLDVQDMLNKDNDLTHILVSIPKTKKSISLQCDIFNAYERYVQIKAPSLYNSTKDSVISQENAAYMRLIIENVNVAYLAIQLNIKTINCSSEKAEITIKTSAKGFDKYYTFYANEQDKNIIVNPPIDSQYNNFVYVDMHMDQSCHLILSQKLSFIHSMRRIVQRFATYLPAHLFVIFIIVLMQQLSHGKENTDDDSRNIFKNALTVSLRYDSIVIAIFCYSIEYFYCNNGIHEILITILLHGTALITSIIISLSICMLLRICARCLMAVIPLLDNIVWLSPSTFIGIVIFSITLVTCCSLGLWLTCLAYFLWLSNLYREYLLLEQKTSSALSKDVIVNIQSQYQHLLLHQSLFQLLLMTCFLNFGETLAWFINYPSLRRIIIFNSQTISNILLIISWFLLLKMENICAYFYDSKIFFFLLYNIAVFCFHYCREKIFFSNFIVASVYLSLLIFCSYFKLKKILSKII